MKSLGALGALDLLFKKKKFEGPVFIAGGDNLSDFDLKKMVSIYEKSERLTLLDYLMLRILN